jgi:hypothetical protein
MYMPSGSPAKKLPTLLLLLLLSVTSACIRNYRELTKICTFDLAAVEKWFAVVWLHQPNKWFAKKWFHCFPRRANYWLQAIGILDEKGLRYVASSQGETKFFFFTFVSSV